MFSSSCILWTPSDILLPIKDTLWLFRELYFCRAVRLITDFTPVLPWWHRTTGLPSRVRAWCSARTSATDCNIAVGGKKRSEKGKSICTKISNSQKPTVELVTLPRTFYCITVKIMVQSQSSTMTTGDLNSPCFSIFALVFPSGHL
jgi:hypothetical protein